MDKNVILYQCVNIDLVQLPSNGPTMGMLHKHFDTIIECIFVKLEN